MIIYSGIKRSVITSTSVIISNQNINFDTGEDVKKIGRTWIIAEQAMIRSSGTLKFEEYKGRVAHTVAQKLRLKN